MIPRAIHYCWFGMNPKPQLVLDCIKSWEEKCPDYKIIEWNESNYDFSQSPLYVKQAYEKKKWAFVTDYVRLQVIYDNGGIYLDTDIELVKNLDDLLSNSSYFGFQNKTEIATGLGFGAEKGCRILWDMMQDYNDIPFIRPDGSLDLLPCPRRNTAAFILRGLIPDGTEQELEGGIHIYPKSYFCPMDYKTGRVELTENTYSIHLFFASWHGKGDMLLDKKKKKYIQKYGEEEGQSRLKNWEKRNKVFLVFMNNGIAGTFGKIKSLITTRKSQDAEKR